VDARSGEEPAARLALVQDEGRRVADRRRLAAAFHGSYDASAAAQALGLPAAQLDRKHDAIGAGRVFAAWRLRVPGARGASAMSLVLKRPHGLGSAARGREATGLRGAPAEVRRWLEALPQALKQGPLMPPCMIVRAGDAWGLVMPYGDAPLAAAASHWQPLDARLAEQRDALAAVGLELADVAQGACWDGVPFLFDLSDLRRR
jgi:hypothetical protein